MAEQPFPIKSPPRLRNLMKRIDADRCFLCRFLYSTVPAESSRSINFGIKLSGSFSGRS